MKNRQPQLSPKAEKCRRVFLRFFPKGFDDAKYFSWERGYKLAAHEQWMQNLNRNNFCKMLEAGKFTEIAALALKIESKTNLLFSFEKMALRDAVKISEGARNFSRGLYDFLHGAGKTETKFNHWIEVLTNLPRKQTRVLTWTNATVFGFLAQPDKHIFLKPKTTKNAAIEYGFDFQYASRPILEYLSKSARICGKNSRGSSRFKSERYDRFAIVYLGNRVG